MGTGGRTASSARSRCLRSVIWFGCSDLGQLADVVGELVQRNLALLVAHHHRGHRDAVRDAFVLLHLAGQHWRTRPGSPSPISTSPPGPRVRCTTSRLRFAAITGVGHPLLGQHLQRDLGGTGLAGVPLVGRLLGPAHQHDHAASTPSITPRSTRLNMWSQQQADDDADRDRQQRTRRPASTAGPVVLVGELVRPEDLLDPAHVGRVGAGLLASLLGLLRGLWPAPWRPWRLRQPCRRLTSSFTCSVACGSAHDHADAGRECVPQRRDFQRLTVQPPGAIGGADERTAHHAGETELGRLGREARRTPPA